MKTRCHTVSKTASAILADAPLCWRRLMSSNQILGTVSKLHAKSWGPLSKRERETFTVKLIAPSDLIHDPTVIVNHTNHPSIKLRHSSPSGGEGTRLLNPEEPSVARSSSSSEEMPSCTSSLASVLSLEEMKLHRSVKLIFSR